MDHPNLFPLLSQCASRRILVPANGAFNAQYGVFSLGPIESRWDVLSLCGLIAPMLRMLRCSLGQPSVIAIPGRHSIP